MAKGRDISADSLNDVLTTALRMQQQGVLSVENQRGDMLVEGEIHIQNGRVTFARTDQLIGQAALREMLGWRQVRFTFAMNQLPPPAHIPASPRPASAVAAKVNSTELAPNLSPAASRDTHLPFTPPGIPQLNIARGEMPSSRDTGFLPEVSDSSLSTPGLEWIIPRRVDKGRNVLSLPLTRPQRSIYMLVDGNRSVGDLARCMRKTIQDVERLLSELQERGLIAV